LGNAPANIPEGSKTNIKSANLYIRPHQFDIAREAQGDNAIKATIKYINLAGSSVKIDLVSESGNSLQVEITQQVFSQLKLNKGENVFVSPKDITFCEYEI
jgi:sulfate transport system ATP-binding protein